MPHVYPLAAAAGVLSAADDLGATGPFPREARELPQRGLDETDELTADHGHDADRALTLADVATSAPMTQAAQSAAQPASAERHRAPSADLPGEASAQLADVTDVLFADLDLDLVGR